MLGLNCDWEKMTTILLSNDPLPADMQDAIGLLQCEWEENYSKLLGLFFGTQIEQDKVMEKLQEKLKDKLNHFKKNLFDFMGRMLAVNQVLMGSAWYALT